MNGPVAVRAHDDQVHVLLAGVIEDRQVRRAGEHGRGDGLASKLLFREQTL